jgi:hypothetical protein
LLSLRFFLASQLLDAQGCLYQDHCSTGWIMNVSAVGFSPVFHFSISSTIHHRSRGGLTLRCYFDTTIPGRSLTLQSGLDTIGPAYDPNGKKEAATTGNPAPHDAAVPTHPDITSAKLNAQEIRILQYPSSTFKLQTMNFYLFHIHLLPLFVTFYSQLNRPSLAMRCRTTSHIQWVHSLGLWHICSSPLRYSWETPLKLRLVVNSSTRNCNFSLAVQVF